MTRPQRERRACRSALSEQDARRLAEAARARGGRKGLAVLFGLYMALRREEIANVRWTDIRDDGWLYLIGKGGPASHLPLHPVVKKALAALDRHGETWVFPARQDRTRRTIGHVTPDTIGNWVAGVARQVDLSVTTHQLRHTALATAIYNTGDIRAVQSFARHSTLDTTSGHTRMTERRLHAVISAITYEEDDEAVAELHRRRCEAVAELAGLFDTDSVWIEAAIAELEAEP